jgi:hypothetical protein
MGAAETIVLTRPVVTSYTWPETVIVSGELFRGVEVGSSRFADEV